MMIKHIVLFKLKPMESEEAKRTLMMNFKNGLEALTGVIPQLRTIEVGLNTNPAEQYDIALVTTFENMDDLHTYATHPLHQEVCKLIADAKEQRACVDFTF